MIEMPSQAGHDEGSGMTEDKYHKMRIDARVNPHYFCAD